MAENRLAQLRKQNSFTQAQVAKELNVSRSTLSLYETNRRKPDYETLSSIADFYDVSIDYLLCRTNVRNADKFIYDIPEGIHDLLMDQSIKKALKDLNDLTLDEKKGFITYLYAIKLNREK